MKWRIPGQEVDQTGLGVRLCKKNRDDAMDCSRRRKLIKMVDDQDRCE